MNARLTRPIVFVLTVLAAAANLSLPARANDSTEVTRKEATQQRRLDNQALQAAARWAQRNPERYAKLVPPAADLAPDGVPITYALRGGGSGQTVADSLLYTVLELGYSELKSRDRAHLGRFYTQLYNILPALFRGGLPEPAVVVGLPLRQMEGAVSQLGERVHRDFDNIRTMLTGTYGIPGLLVNPIGQCSNEVGWEAGGVNNENANRCEIADYASLGLMAKLEFVLKDDLTCVKDQRARGTCVAHSLSANVETMIQVQGGAPENLAEQDLYFWAKIETGWDKRYKDGLSATSVYDALVAQGFEIQYEARWNYNQSPGRGALDTATNQFPASCDLANYTGEMCTDYAFQAQEAQQAFGYTYLYPLRASTGWKILNWTSIPDMTQYQLPDGQIDSVILYLEAEFPVTLSFSTPLSFRTPDANGYVNYNPADPTPKGKHSVLAIGFVANADLPVGVPLDPDGRGYVIIKNSWGTGYADCGFSYLSTEFLRQWGVSYQYLDKTVTFN